MENIEPNAENGPPDIKYPEGLTERDVWLVTRQCELQSATDNEQVEGFATAYSKAKNLVADIEKFKSLTPDDIEKMIRELASLTETRNQKGYRCTPVTFRSGGIALSPELIERAMKNFSVAYSERSLAALEIYTEFQKIHPFEDGNGRVGDLLWKMYVAVETEQWPEELPPDVFGSEIGEGGQE